MQCVAACILLLAICGPVLVNSKKVVLVVPRQIRRSPALSSRVVVQQPTYQSKRSYYANAPKHSYDTTSIYYGKSKPYGYDKKFPHGGDDFDQGHEPTRHITIPHGKGISHGISFGRGYIPYTSLKSELPKFPSPESRPEISYHHQPSINAGPTASEALYSGPGSSQSSQFSPSSFSPSNYNFHDDKAVIDHLDQLNQQQDKYLNLRSADNAGNPSNAINYASKSISSDNFKASSPLQKSSSADLNNPGHNIVSLNNNGKGIVISDSVLLEDYNKKVEEFTNSWPKIVGHSMMNHPGTQGLLIGGLNVPVAQGRQSYAVHEDQQEPQTNFHGVINSQFQPSHSTKNVDVSSLISVQG